MVENCDITNCGEFNARMTIKSVKLSEGKLFFERKWLKKLLKWWRLFGRISYEKRRLQNAKRLESLEDFLYRRRLINLPFVFPEMI